MNEDPELRARFASLRGAELARAPSFDSVLRRVRRRSTHTVAAFAGAACLIIAAVLTILHVSHDHKTVGLSAPMLAQWRSPTDFLLDTPGRQLLRIIPDIGTIPDIGVAPVRLLDPVSPTHKTTPARDAGREHS